jgi:uncharacterized protein (DUF58 family)
MTTGAATAPLRWRATWNAGRLGVAILALALAAVNYQSNAAWMLTLLLAAAAVVAVFHARRNLAGVGGSAGPVPAVFAGDPIPVPVVLRNGAATMAIAVWATAAEDGDAPAPPQMIPPGGSVAASITLAPRHRGRYQLPVLRAASTFPLGVVEVQSRLPEAGIGIVYPRPEGRSLDDAFGAGEPGDGLGEQDGDDFAGHRRPRPGDPPRHLDWKAAARGRPLLMKAFAGGTCQCLLTWQAAQGDGEQRLSELARWVLDAEARGWRYGLSLPGVELDHDGGPEHRERCLRALALVVLP